MPSSDPEMTLSELIKDIADELRSVKKNPIKPGHAVIELTECEIETNVQLLYKADAKVKLWLVLDIGGEASRTSGHKIRLKFKVINGFVQANSTQLGADGTSTPAGKITKANIKNKKQDQDD